MQFEVDLRHMCENCSLKLLYIDGIKGFNLALYVRRIGNFTIQNTGHTRTRKSTFLSSLVPYEYLEKQFYDLRTFNIYLYLSYPCNTRTSIILDSGINLLDNVVNYQ